MSELTVALMERDDITEKGAEELIRTARREIANGADPEEILDDYFGLELDYIFDLL